MTWDWESRSDLTVEGEGGVVAAKEVAGAIVHNSKYSKFDFWKEKDRWESILSEMIATAQKCPLKKNVWASKWAFPWVKINAPKEFGRIKR